MPPSPTEAPELVERVAVAVDAHPAVAGLFGGTYGDVSTYLPGRRLVGVRIDGDGGPVAVGVVLNLDQPIPEAVSSLRRLVSDMCGGATVDITVGDVIVGRR